MMAKLDRDVTRVEHIMNRRWIHQLVDGAGRASADHLHHLGQIIGACWRARLDDFCGSDCHEVLMTYSKEDEECSVSFHRRRK